MLGWGALGRDSAGVAQLIQAWVGAGWDQLLFQGWGKGTFWAEPFSPQVCLDGAAARLQVGTRVVFSGILREWLDLRCLSSSWCWQLHIFQRAGGKPSVAGDFAAFTTSFSLTTGMKKMGVRHEPMAGVTLGNPSVTMLPMICEFLCFESTPSATVPLRQGMSFPSQRVSVTFDGFHKTSTEIMEKQVLCWTECFNWVFLQWACRTLTASREAACTKCFRLTYLGLTGMTEWWMLRFCDATIVPMLKC